MGAVRTTAFGFRCAISTSSTSRNRGASKALTKAFLNPMDANENIPCSIDGTGFGRITTDGESKGCSKLNATIAKPDIRDRGVHWLASNDEVTTFEFPDARISTPAERILGIRYAGDSLDELWVEKVAASLRGKVDASSMNSFSVSFLENVFTALELLAEVTPSVTFHRLRLDVKQLEHDCGYKVPLLLLEHATEYWKAKRRANGGMPLIPALKSSEVCQEDILGDCPLPFAKRDGDMYASIQVHDVPWRKRPRIDYSTQCLIEDSRRLASALLSREDALYEHCQLSLYELATLRREACQ